MGDVVMRDRPYSFDAQLFYTLEPPMEMKAGDKIRVECTYSNTTGETVGYGDSSLEEMDFASTYRYPAVCIR